MSNRTKSETTAADINALLRARNSLIIVTTREEARVERYLIEAAAAAGYVPRTWDIAQGVADLSGRIVMADKLDPNDALDVIRARATGEQSGDRGVWIMRDLLPWVSGPGGVATQRRLRNLARTLPSVPLNNAQAVIILSAGGDVPAELAAHATVIDWPLPDRAEIADILDAAVASLPDELRTKAAPNGQRDAAIDAAVGLTGEEAQACYASSLVKLKRIDPAAVAQEKRRVISRERVLEWFDPLPGGLSMVGGLENLKAWLMTRLKAFSIAAREYGLPAPKGAFVAGISGCGKTMIAKACATAWQVPLLRWDIGAAKSKFVGESETNLRRALKVIEAIGPCVVLLDEIEKAMQGATSGSSDGGVSADALGTILTWMQERTSQAFVIATANDISGLPPELLRKGRFDEVFWVDLPTHTEREAIVAATLRERGREPGTVDLSAVAKATDGWTGAEIAAVVPDAMNIAFSDNGREPTTADILAAAKPVVPLSKTADKKIADLRAWGKTRARAASASETETKADVSRILDMA